jgi:hypothetical protein
MGIRSIIAAPFCVCLLLADRPVWACQILVSRHGPPAPTAESIVRDAEVIVVATPIRYLREPMSIDSTKNDPRLQSGLIQFRVESTLKGVMPGDALAVEGWLTDKDYYNDHSVPYRFGRGDGVSATASTIG